MDEQLISQVEDLGLSNKEARVYVANLMLGPAGVQQIADASGIKRVTTYVILESLVGLGLVSQTSKAKKTLFNAESPENLRRLLDKKEQAIKDQKAQLDELLPQLGSLSNMPKDAPAVKFYDGAEGIRTIHKLFLEELKNSKGTVALGMGNLEDVHEFFPEIAASEANPNRVASGVKSKYLYTSSRGPIYKGTDAQSNRESRYIPKENYPFEGDISIMGNRVILLFLKGNRPTGIVVESESFARSMTALFNLAWESAEKYS